MMKKPTLSRDLSLGNFALQETRGNGTWMEYFLVYFNYGFFTLCIPFRFRMDSSIRRYQMQTMMAQKVLCFILYVGTWICIITNFRNMQQQDFQKNPLLYIVLASVTLDSIYLLWVFEMFWRRAHLFQEFIDELQSTALMQFCSGSLNHARALSGGLCFMSLAQAAISAIYKLESGDWSEGRLWKSMVRDARYMFMLDDSTILSDNMSTCLAILCLAINFVYQLLKNLSDMIGLTSVIMLRHVVNDLLHVMKSDDFSPSLMQSSYDALRDLMEKLNFAVGVFIFFIFLGPVPFYSINIVDMIDAPDYLLLTSNCIYLSVYFMTLILAARINKKGFRLKHWLEKNGRYEKIPEPKLLMLLHDISYDEIGISGCGYFTATSGLVGTIVSLILTYAIIVVQFRATETGEGVDGNAEASQLLMEDPTWPGSANFTARRLLTGATYKYLF